MKLNTFFVLFLFLSKSVSGFWWFWKGPQPGQVEDHERDYITGEKKDIRVPVWKPKTMLIGSAIVEHFDEDDGEDVEHHWETPPPGVSLDVWYDYLGGPPKGLPPPKGTTVKMLIKLHDLEDEDIKWAINLDFGTYSAMDYAFRYFNAANYHPPKPHGHYADICFEDYIRCVYSFAYHTKICGYTGGYKSQFNREFFSPCELWLTNCRTSTRLWHSTGARQENRMDGNFGGCRWPSNW